MIKWFIICFLSSFGFYMYLAHLVTLVLIYKVTIRNHRIKGRYGFFVFSRLYIYICCLPIYDYFVISYTSGHFGNFVRTHTYLLLVHRAYVIRDSVSWVIFRTSFFSYLYVIYLWVKTYCATVLQWSTRKGNDTSTLFFAQHPSAYAKIWKRSFTKRRRRIVERCIPWWTLRSNLSGSIISVETTRQSLDSGKILYIEVSIVST